MADSVGAEGDSGGPEEFGEEDEEGPEEFGEELEEAAEEDSEFEEEPEEFEEDSDSSDILYWYTTKTEYCLKHAG